MLTIIFNLINVAKAAGIVNCGPGTHTDPADPASPEVECDSGQFLGLLHNLMTFAVEIAIIIVGLSVAYGGFMILISSGSEERMSQGKKAMKASIIGIIIIFTAWLVVNTLITLFTNCSGWNVFGGIKCG